MGCEQGGSQRRPITEEVHRATQRVDGHPSAGPSDPIGNIRTAARPAAARLACPGHLDTAPHGMGIQQGVDTHSFRQDHRMHQPGSGRWLDHESHEIPRMGSVGTEVSIRAQLSHRRCAAIRIPVPVYSCDPCHSWLRLPCSGSVPNGSRSILRILFILSGWVRLHLFTDSCLSVSSV